MKDKGAKCNCIRCREAGDRQFKINDLQLIIKKYQTSGGMEYFISYESKDKKILYGFCRLRLPNIVETQNFASSHNRPPIIETQNLASLPNPAIIRELHIYGELVPVGQNKKVQHSGLGKKLMLESEKIAKNCKYKKIIVISGIGAREYYKKLGYKLENTYMVKNI
jgi:elongator complex protein 3